MNYRFAILACAAMAAVGSLFITACSAEDKSIVTTNGYKITKGELDSKLEGMPLAHEVLRNMVQQDLVFQYAKDHNIQVSDSEIDDQINQIKQHLSDQQLNDALKQQGMTMQDLRDVMRERVIVKKAVDSGITVTNAQMTDYLKKNHETLDQAAQVRARHILVSTKATADMIEAKLRAGADFAQLAKQYSSDPGTKDKGGELGFFAAGAMVKEFSDVAFSMKPGQISQPVHSPYGWHIIQVEEKKPAQIATLQNSESKIRDSMLQSQEQLQIPTFMQNLQSSAKVTVIDPQYNDLLPSPAPTVAAPPAPTKTK